MKIKQTRFVGLSFLFLAISLLMLFSPFAGKAQNDSPIDLAGTEWSTASTSVINIDNSITTLTRYLIFSKQGKVEAAIVKDKSAGSECKQVVEPVLDSVYNYVTGRYETQYVNKLVYKCVPTAPALTPVTWQGTYEIKGKSVYLDFPAFTIRATVYSSTMKCVVTYKHTSGKEEWILFAKEINQNNSNGGNSSLTSTTNSADTNNDPNLLIRPPWDILHSQAQTLLDLLRDKTI